MNPTPQFTTFSALATSSLVEGASCWALSAPAVAADAEPAEESIDSAPGASVPSSLVVGADSAASAWSGAIEEDVSVGALGDSPWLTADATLVRTNGFALGEVESALCSSSMSAAPDDSKPSRSIHRRIGVWKVAWAARLITVVLPVGVDMAVEAALDAALVGLELEADVDAAAFADVALAMADVVEGAEEVDGDWLDVGSFTSCASSDDQSSLFSGTAAALRVSVHATAFSR